MKNYNKKRKILFDKNLLDKIVNSIIITEQEKLYFLKHIVYLTGNEKKELYNLV